MEGNIPVEVARAAAQVAGVLTMAMAFQQGHQAGAADQRMKDAVKIGVLEWRVQQLEGQAANPTRSQDLTS